MSFLWTHPFHCFLMFSYTWTSASYQDDTDTISYDPFYSIPCASVSYVSYVFKANTNFLLCAPCFILVCIFIPSWSIIRWSYVSYHYRISYHGDVFHILYIFILPDMAGKRGLRKVWARPGHNICQCTCAIVLAWISVSLLGGKGAPEEEGDFWYVMKLLPW